ncbi:MAG: sigma-54-dependent Fis family transcriptional regulator [Paraglaciecola sp.]|uniref:sigma-54 interaction domain-containing protein n=1 Tax=Paraglaciecola sp. TaxID=1920173 RepID=UPI00273F479F|nr:sigma-54-dependent Fis family transcriptional regulator [Paraglaciecola sp.]MDP5032831.1 sigma-54-dependent Fis family transcriptional regulator [Paraglaciecola sp.]MDP5130958.1 sigma-54-dependent Fis family transcriptional regulator [Paraglaciecola sp.]
METSVIQSMINAIDKPTIFITPDYVIKAVNQGYLDTYEVEVELGKSKCFEISHQNPSPCDKHGEACPLQECVNTHRAASVVHIHSTGKGKSYCDILMRPVLDDDGITIGFLEVLNKIDYASAESKQHKMIGKSPLFKSLLNQINRAAPSNIAVLLQGETGTGKELVAQAVHDASKRSDKSFVVIECTGLSENLFESELFGHEKGAFTGASTSKKGLIEIAHGGTVFFDEIGDVPLNMQVKLLRLLETQSFRAVGGLKLKYSDFRLVCATHKNLLAMVERGEFRRDLYYRIAGFPIQLPPLRERREDIPELTKHFLRYSEYQHKTFSTKALERMCSYAFPGNIRELKSVIEHASLLADDDVVHASDLVMLSSPTTPLPQVNHYLSLDEVESEYLRGVCINFQGTPAELADMLKVSTRTLYRKLQRYGLKLNSEI